MFVCFVSSFLLPSSESRGLLDCIMQSSFILCVLCCSASWRHCWWTWCRSLWRADIPSWCCADQSLWWRSSSPTGCPCASTSTSRWAQFTSDGICTIWGPGGGGGYAFYSISSLTIPVVWLVIVFVLADWWWPVFGGGVVFLPKFINLYYAVYAATAAFMTLAFTDGSWKKENGKKKSNNLLSTVLAMSTKQGSARSLKACMVLVDTALFANCSLANYC